MSRTLCLIAFCLFVWAICGCSRGEAQSADSATIAGRVTDPSGAVVAGVTVVARNTDTGIEQTTKTTGSGFYRFPTLPLGNYSVRVEAGQNFKRGEISGIVLEVDAKRDVNFQLTLAGSTTRVEVSAEAPLIESTKTDISTVLNDVDMQRMPMTSAPSVGGSMNDYSGVALTVPGVRLDHSGNSFDLLGPGSINDHGDLFNVDGGNITDSVNSGRDVHGASIDEVQEVEVLTNNYNAEYGQAGGIILNVVTKSGTNSLHGDFHFYARGRNLTASTFFFNQGLSRKPNPFVGCTVPPCPVDGQPRAPFFKHETGFTLGGPLIKGKTFWFVSLEKLLAGKPLTLTPPTGPVTVTQPDDELMWSAKLDHELTKNNHVSVRFNEQRLTQSNLVETTRRASLDSLGAKVLHDHTLGGSLVTTVTPDLVNEARFFWHRHLSHTTTQSDSPGLQGPNFFQGADPCCPQANDQNLYQGTDNLTWVHGSHTLKGGASMTYLPYVELFQQYHFGLWSFSKPFPSSAPGGSNPPTTLTFAEGPGVARSKDNIYAWYVQDTWKIRPNLTLNYGLRYDYEAGAFRGGAISQSGGGCLQANGIVPACSSDKNNFQPRLGVAWGPRFAGGLGHFLFGDANKSLISAGVGEITQLAYLNLAEDSFTFDGVTLLNQSVNLTAGNCNSNPAACPNPALQNLLSFYPNLPPPSALAPFAPAGNFGTVRHLSNHLRNPETRDASLTIKRELSSTTVLSLGYVGSFGFGQFGEVDTNYPTINPDPAHPGFFYFGPRPDPRFQAIRTISNGRTSAYNGFVFNLKQRLAHHVQLNGSYVLSKTFTSAEDFYGTSEPGDPRDIRAERALSYNDARHAFNLGLVFDSENLSNMRGIRHFVNDWQVGVIGTANSANPYPISTGEVAFSGLINSGVGGESPQRPNVLSNGVLSARNLASNTGANLLISQAGVGACQASGQPQCPTQTTWLAPATASPDGPSDSFTGSPVDFQFLNGDLNRSAGRTDPYYRFDVSLTRTFRIPRRETMRVELRADFFNIFNHTNFLLFNQNNDLDALPVAQPLSSDGSLNPNFAACALCLDPFTGFYRGANGQVLTVAALQQGRVSPTNLVNTGNGPFGAIGDPATTDSPRQIQLSVHVKW
jgi:hypothetical protein